MRMNVLGQNNDVYLLLVLAPQHQFLTAVKSGVGSSATVADRRFAIYAVIFFDMYFAFGSA